LSLSKKNIWIRFINEGNFSGFGMEVDLFDEKIFKTIKNSSRLIFSIAFGYLIIQNIKNLLLKLKETDFLKN
jgi:hypothetical protein